MNQVEISELAVDDLTEIWEYIAANNRTAANRLYSKFQSTFEKLADTPGMGRRREELSAGLRSFPVGNYIIYYQEISDGVQIKRVLHGARLAEDLFKDADEG